MTIISDGQAAQILKRTIEERVWQRYASRLTVAGAEERRRIEMEIQKEVAGELKQHLQCSAHKRCVPVIH